MILSERERYGEAILMRVRRMFLPFHLFANDMT